MSDTTETLSEQSVIQGERCPVCGVSSAVGIHAAGCPKLAEAQQTDRETYSMRVRCGNCHDEERIKIPVGQAIEETACPTCGCQQLRAAFLATGYRS